jgi:hypothetical protein
VSNVSGTYILANRKLVAPEVLEDNANSLPQCVDIPFL